MFLAATEQASGLGALGLDIKSIIFQMIAFVLVVWILKKFAIDKLLGVIDARRDELRAGLERSEEAKRELDNASKGAELILAEARTQADEISASARVEAVEIASKIEQQAQAKAARIDADARDHLAQDAAKVRQDLKVEAAKLVAQASGLVLDEKLDAPRDNELIVSAIESAGKS